MRKKYCSLEIAKKKSKSTNFFDSRKSKQLTKSIQSFPDNNYIDKQMLLIMYHKSPEGTNKFLRKNKRIVSQSSVMPEEHRDIFERTFYKEQRKSYNKIQRSKQIKQNLIRKFKLRKKNPEPFFQITKANITYMENKFWDRNSQRTINSHKTTHPISDIYVNTISKFFSTNRRDTLGYPGSAINLYPFEGYLPIPQ